MGNIINQLLNVAKKKPNKVSLVQDGVEISYDHLFRLVYVTRDYLGQKISCQRDGFVVIMLSMPVDALVAILAARWLGYKTIVAYAQDSFVFEKVFPIRAVITNESETEKKLDVLQEGLGKDYEIILIPKFLYRADALSRIDYNRIKVPDRIGSHVLYSSGSTGTPKLIEFSDKIEERAAKIRIDTYRIRAVSKIHNLGVFLSAGSGWHNYIAVVYAGATLIDSRSSRVLEAFLTPGVTHMFLNAAFLNRLIEFRNKYPFPKNNNLLIRVSGGFTSYSRLQWIKENITENVHIGMGVTEACEVIFSAPVKCEEDAMWMRRLPSAEIEIFTGAGELVPDGQEGWLAVKIQRDAPQEYLFDAAQSAERFRAGYFNTGDLAIRRSDGRIRLLGRISETISYSGGKLSTGRVESEINDTLPYTNSFVFSRQNEQFVDEIVVCLEGAESVRDEDLEWLKSKFGSSSSLIVKTVAAFPYLHSGKIDRIGLRKMILRNDLTSIL